MYEKVVDYCIDVSYCLYNYIWNYVMHLEGMLHKVLIDCSIIGMIEQSINTSVNLSLLILLR